MYTYKTFALGLVNAPFRNSFTIEIWSQNKRFVTHKNVKKINCVENVLVQDYSGIGRCLIIL